MLPDFLISYHYPSEKSEVLFLLPDFSNPLSSIPIRVRSTFFCSRTSYHIITFRRSLRYLYAYRLLILIVPSFPKVRSTRLCTQTLLLSYPLGLCASFAAGPSLVWSEVPAVLFRRPSSSVRGTMCAMDRGQVVQSEVLYMPLDQCQSVRSEVLSMLSDVCQTVHSVGSFHLPFRLPFLLSFALSFALSSALSLSFPFLSPPDLGRNYF